MNTVIELDDVALTRGETQILNNITWNTHRGEQWAVLGCERKSSTDKRKCSF